MDKLEFKVGRFTLLPFRQLVENGVPVSLGRKALDLLSVLAKANGALVTKDELMEAVWPNAIVEENAIQVHIAALRKVLGEDADLLTTTRGLGYRLAPTEMGLTTERSTLRSKPAVVAEDKLLPRPAETSASPIVIAARSRRSGKWRVIKAFVVTTMIIAVAGIGLLLNHARQSQSVIVDTFDAPPDLTMRGMSGKIVARRVLDELVRLDAATPTTLSKRSLSNPWNGEIKVEVPGSGLSFEELEKTFRARFGHDLHIDGDLVQTPDGGLALSVRGSGVQSKTFTGASDELGKLAVQAAEYIYGQSQPALLAVYLDRSNRFTEALAFCKGAFPTAGQRDRPYLLNAWGVALSVTGGDPHEVSFLFRRALELKPDFWSAYGNLTVPLLMLQDEEGVWRVGEDMRKAAGGRPGKAQEVAYEAWDAVTWNLQAKRNAFLADAALNGGAGTMVANSITAPILADIDVRMHDFTDADFQLQTARAAPDAPVAAALSRFVRGRLAAEKGDVQRAVVEMEAFGVSFSDPNIATSLAGYSCWIAPVEEAAGHPDRADTVLKAAGRYVDCYRFKADILDQRGDWVGAQKAYQDAVDLAPDLPSSYYSWGVALGRHGDAESAEAKLEAASQRGPHWADPLKAWGDLLARKGDWRGARAKYDAAIKYAPAWPELHTALDEANRRLP